jgi:hypothetical protein
MGEKKMMVTSSKHNYNEENFLCLFLGDGKVVVCAFVLLWLFKLNIIIVVVVVVVVVVIAKLLLLSLSSLLFFQVVWVSGAGGEKELSELLFVLCRKSEICVEESKVWGFKEGLGFKGFMTNFFFFFPPVLAF